MADEEQMLRRELTHEGRHPNDAGFEVMLSLAEEAIAEALKQ